VFVFALGALLRLVASGGDVAIEDVLSALFYGVFALVAALTLALAWHLFAAPYRLYVGQKQAANRATNEVTRLTAALERRANYEQLGRNIRRVVDDGMELLNGQVDGRTYRAWMERASELAGCFDEGDKHMLQTMTMPGKNALADHRPLLIENIGKLRLIMGRVFEAAKRSAEEAKE
jgi:hypothetical protein